jgi:hypothetical protein
MCIIFCFINFIGKHLQVYKCVLLLLVVQMLLMNAADVGVVVIVCFVYAAQQHKKKKGKTKHNTIQKSPNKHNLSFRI